MGHGTKRKISFGHFRCVSQPTKKGGVFFCKMGQTWGGGVRGDLSFAGGTIKSQIRDLVPNGTKVQCFRKGPELLSNPVQGTKEAAC